MILLAVLFGAIAAALLLPVASDCLSLLRARRRDAPASGGWQRVIVLVPAHNEERILDRCLDALAGAERGFAATTVVVVADNCTDRTAEIARGRGVRCLERQDPSRRGKPFALAWALARLADEPFDALFILDADSVVTPQVFTHLAAAGPWAGRVGQAGQLVWMDDQNWLTRLSRVFNAAKWGVAFGIKHRAGMNIPLAGTGMIFGKDAATQVDWAGFGPAEDLELYALLSRQGVEIAYVPDAVVHVLVETSLRASGTQRRRWSSGRTLAAWRLCGPLLKSSRTGWHQKIDALAELLTPGPVEQTLLVTALVALALVLDVPAAWPLSTALLVSLIRPVGYALVALWRDPHPIGAMSALAMLPVYALWRWGVALTTPKILVSRRWEKTSRG